jgi:hypothetical protein
MPDGAVVVLDRATIANATTIQSNWIDPAVAALERGTLASLSLLADGHGMAAAWNAQRPTWNRRAVARFAPRPFAPPLSDEDNA